MVQTEICFVETKSADQRNLLCQWVEHFHEAGKMVQVVTDSTLSAQHLDQLLWTFSQSSFVPHRVCASDSLEPLLNEVIITVGEVPLQGYEILLCDGPVSLEFMVRYALAVHFVLLDDAERRQDSRLLWQSARDLGVRLHHVPRSPRPNPPTLGR